MSGGINFDTTSLGGGGNYGGYGGYYGGYCGSNILDIAALGLVFGDGIGRRGYDDKKCGCCAPATCEQVNDVDRDVLKCSFDATEAMHEEARTIDRDVLMGDKCIEQKICDSTHKLEKDIWDTDKDVLIGFKDTDHKIDMVKCEMKEGFAEVKGLIKETALCNELREEKRENAKLARKNEELHDVILKKDIVAEVLAAMGISPVIATR